MKVSSQRRFSCSAAAAWAAAAALPSLQQEIQLESTMHVSGLAAAQCEARYGFLPGLASAPSLEANQDSSADGRKSAGAEFFSAPSLGDSKSLAACLATPSEPVENTLARVRLVASYNGIR